MSRHSLAAEAAALGAELTVGLKESAGRRFKPQFGRELIEIALLAAPRQRPYRRSSYVGRQRLGSFRPSNSFVRSRTPNGAGTPFGANLEDRKTLHRCLVATPKAASSRVCHVVGRTDARQVCTISGVGTLHRSDMGRKIVMARAYTKSSLGLTRSVKVKVARW
jgi:hypothetical protein